MAQATWAYRPLRGSPWVLKYPYCHQMTTQPHRRGDRRVLKKVDFSKNFRCHLKNFNNNNFGAFEGSMAWATWA